MIFGQEGEADNETCIDDLLSEVVLLRYQLMGIPR